LTLPSTGFARIVLVKNPLDGVLDAQLVLIVRKGPNARLFRIDQVFWGDAKAGDLIDLGNFQLATVQQYGSSVIDRIAPETRILVFLKPENDPSAPWQPTYFQEAYFWVQKPEDEQRLRNDAQRAVEARRQWEKARSTFDRATRVVALWPFLSFDKYGVGFYEHTKTELEEAKPKSGEYFASHFEDLPTKQRRMLLSSAGDFGSNQLHQKMQTFLVQEMKAYESFVHEFGRVPTQEDWNTLRNTLPSKIKDVTGNIYYGLAGFAKYGRRGDLPFIRKMAVWAANYDLEQTAEAAMNAFRDMPDENNLPAIRQVLAKFLPEKLPGMASIDVDAERALCKHHYAQTVPLLVPFLKDDFLRPETESCLADIAGSNLGSDPHAWMEWYKSQQ
jgi:hypothetical protein